MAILIASVIGALLVSALCSLLEAAVLSLTPAQLADFSKHHPRSGVLWRGFKAHIEKPIAVILILNTAAHTIGATLAGAQFEALFGDQGLLWFSLLFTYLMLQFTEILPKTLGVHYNRVLAPWIALPLAVLIKLLAPVLFLVHLVNRPFERRGSRSGSEPTRQEISALAGLARVSNIINPYQERIIKGASLLSDVPVADVMIPVEQVTFLSTSQHLMDAVITAHEDPHTRFPICENNDRNRVAGYVNFKEMIYHGRTNPQEQSLRGIIRPVHFVDPDQSAASLLRAFVDQHEHLAIVRDEQGKTLGMVTLEDIIEELVGELEDEFDRLPRMLHPLQGGTWMVGGGVPIHMVARTIGVELPDAAGTTSSWLIRRFGRVPRINEVFRDRQAAFTVRRTRRGKIFEVAVTRTS
jgi:putative hemolysin